MRLGEVLELGVRSPNVSVLLVSFVPFCLNSAVIVARTSMYITRSGSTVAEQLEV